MAEAEIELRVATVNDHARMRKFLSDPAISHSIFIGDAIKAISKGHLIIALTKQDKEVVGMIQSYAVTEGADIMGRLQQFTLDKPPHERRKLAKNYLLLQNGTINTMNCADAGEYIYSPQTDLLVYTGSFFIKKNFRGGKHRMTWLLWIHSWRFLILPIIQQIWFSRGNAGGASGASGGGPPYRLVSLQGTEMGDNGGMAKLWSRYLNKGLSVMYNNSINNNNYNNNNNNYNNNNYNNSISSYVNSDNTPLIDQKFIHMAYLHLRPDTATSAEGHMVIVTFDQIFLPTAKL